MARETSNGCLTRRKFLIASTAVGGVGVAGCTSDPSTDGDGGDGSDGNSSDGDLSGGGSDGGDLSGEVIITGSSTVFPISKKMAENFQQEHSDVNISVDSTGSGGGFKNHFCPGNSDINGASRPIKDSEVEQCNGNDVEPIEFEIGGDALTVAVNNEADWVDCLSFDELAQIWQPDGAERWSDVRDDWPDEEFELYGPASTSGTFDWFTENVVGESGSMRDDYEATEDDNRIIQGIQGSEAAMGFFGYAYYAENEDRVKAVEIKESEDGECVEPSLDNAKSGDYPMSRPLFIYGSEQSIQENEQVYEFLNYYVEQAETDLVKEVGYVPSSEEQRDENLDKLEEAAGN